MKSLMKSKKGVGFLTGIAFAIVTLIILVGLGITIIYQLGGSVAVCATGYTWDKATDKCLNATGGDPTTPTGSAYESTTYGITQMGETGLLGWLPAIIALMIGMFFLAYFMGKKGGYQ